MKRLLLLTFLVSNLSFGQTPDYFGNEPSWQCRYWNSNQWIPPYIPYWEHFVYYVNGDTSAAGYTYQKIHRRGYRDVDFNSVQKDVLFDEPTGWYVRQVGRTIRYFDLQAGVDSLLISYEKNVGDTFDHFEGQGCWTSTDTIQKIDSVLVNNAYRKVFYLDSTTGPVITEGIGHQSFIDFDEGHVFYDWCSGVGFSYAITCYGENEIPYWQSESNGAACQLDVGLKEVKLKTAQLFQNPVDHSIQIIQPLKEGEYLTLYDLNGQRLQYSNTTSMNVSNVPNGVYLLIIEKWGQAQAQTKVTILH